MWLSKQTKRIRPAPAAQYAVASIGGENPAVLSDTEYRDLPVCSMGGVYWLPKVGQELVVLSPDSLDKCIIGCVADAPQGMQTGDVYIVTDCAAIRIKNSGGVEITGDVSITGTLTLNGNSLGGEGENDGT